jgi:thiol-disulfide isomerase/thioredoxin
MTVKPKKGNLKRLFLFNGLLFVIALLLIQYSVVTHGDEGAPQDSINMSDVLVPEGEFAKKLTLYDAPQAFPDLQFKTAFDKAVKLSDFKGQWIILNFWATWCPPCLVEMPYLQQLQDDMGEKGIQVIGLSLDRNMDGKRLREFMKKHQFGPIAAYYGDFLTIKDQVEIRGLPITYIITPDGQMIGYYEGDAYWSGEESKAFITSLLTLAQP